jgi:hypothetical protein
VGYISLDTSKAHNEPKNCDKFLLTSGKKKFFLFRNCFWFRSGNERKLFVQFQFGILLELRMTSSKVIEANLYQKAIFVVVVGYISLDTSKAHNEPKNCVDIKTALNLH